MAPIWRTNLYRGVSILGLALLLFGTSEDTWACHKGTPHGQDTDCGGGGDGGGEGGKVSLQGTFRDDAVDRLQSDGSTYFNSEPGVDLDIKRGQLRFDLNSDGSTGTRTFFVDFSDCVAACTPPFLMANVGAEGDGVGVGTYAILDVFHIDVVGVGETLARDASLLIAYVVDPEDNEVEKWRVHFRNDPPSLCPDGSSNSLIVSHPDADTWVVEATLADVGCLLSEASNPGGDGSREFHGTYTMPFRLTLVAF